MTGFQPEMDPKAAERLLQAILKEPISDLRPIEGGELSKAYSYRLRDREFVVRFNRNGEGFRKERYIFEHFAPQGLPIPRMHEVGRAGELYYSIADKIPGKSLVTYPEDDVAKLVPEVVRVFTDMNRIRPAGTRGYGWIQPSGDGAYDDWVSFLTSFFQEEQTGFWEGWHELFERSFLERDLFDRWYALMIDLARSAPEERYLVHGDFHFGNMLSDGSALTGVVDWEMAMYGDFVFDLATQHLWTPHFRVPQTVRETWAREGVDIPRFEERLLCALLFKGLDGLRFYAKQGNKDAYDSAKRQIAGFIRDAQAD